MKQLMGDSKPYFSQKHLARRVQYLRNMFVSNVLLKWGENSLTATEWITIHVLQKFGKRNSQIALQVDCSLKAATKQLSIKKVRRKHEVPCKHFNKLKRAMIRKALRGKLKLSGLKMMFKFNVSIRYI